MNISLILDKVIVQPNGCWQWQKSTNSAGYGQITINKKYWLAHRYALSCTTQVKPTDVVRHICHNTRCCNPEHLITGTHKDNYNDSPDAHEMGASSKRLKWVVGENEYKSFKEALVMTGLSSGSLSKYSNNGFFDVMAYRSGCIKANKIPKV